MFPLTDLQIRFPSLDEKNGERTARKMIDLAYRDGTRALCYTAPLPPSAGKAEVLFRRELLNYASERYPDLTMLAAAELTLQSEEDAEALSDSAPTLGHSDMLLVSLDPGVPPAVLFRMLMRLRASGRGVLLSRADTLSCFQKQPSLAQRIAELGICFQVSAGSVLGENGLLRKGFCQRMLKESAIFSIASDATDHLYHPPLLSKCYKRISRLFGEETAYKLFCYHPSSVLGLSEIDPA
jgi:tyrosine-protein phosphatase YwqE